MLKSIGNDATHLRSWKTSHSVRLTTASLTVSEAGRHATVKNTVNQRAGGVSNKIEQLT